MRDLEVECPNAALTDHIVAEAESMLNVRLPVSYVDALRQKNDGSTIGEYIRLPAQDIPRHLEGYVDHGYVSIGGLNGVGTSHQSITRTRYLTNEWQLPNGLVLLDGDGHTWIAFDYRKPCTDVPTKTDPRGDPRSDRTTACTGVAIRSRKMVGVIVAAP